MNSPVTDAREARVVLRTAEHWRTWRDLRLASLIDSPRAFWSTYAQALVRAALDLARAEGVHRVVLEVAHENRRAWAFYERLGFRATGRVATMPWDDSVTEEEMALEVGVPWPGARPAS